MNNNKYENKQSNFELTKRIDAFAELGKILKGFIDEKEPDNAHHNILQKAISEAKAENQWFIEKFSLKSIEGLCIWLKKDVLTNWISKYKINNPTKVKTIGIVMAGNIPLVGFHDLMCVLLSGNKARIKQSSKDNKLIKAIIDILVDIESGFKESIIFCDSQLKGFDAIIATGSNNSSRYFDYYFGKYPNIIRKNRNSIAILKGDEKREQLYALANDIFMYFGLGCRNVSKIYIPEGFDLPGLINCFKNYEILSEHVKFSNNYIYNKSLLLMDNTPFYDTGFALLSENTGLYSPVSVLYYEYYKNIETIKQRIAIDKQNLQCVVSNYGITSNDVDFGQTQNPDINDYADNVDTMKFLESLNN